MVHQSVGGPSAAPPCVKLNEDCQIPCCSMLLSMCTHRRAIANLCWCCGHRSACLPFAVCRFLLIWPLGTVGLAWLVRSVTKSGLKTKYFMIWFWFTELVEVLQQTGIVELPKSTIPLSGKIANLPLSGNFANLPLSIYPQRKICKSSVVYLYYLNLYPQGKAAV